MSSNRKSRSAERLACHTGQICGSKNNAEFEAVEGSWTKLSLPELITEDIEKASELMDQLKKGTKLMKCRGKKKQYTRNFVIANDHLSFGYTDSHKAKCMKGEDQQRVSITEVHEVRIGFNTDVFVKQKPRLEPKYTEDQCFSVVIGEKHKTLDLVAPTKEVKDLWVRSLKHMLKKHSEADLATQQDIWMKELFKLADKNNDGALNIKEIAGLLKHLNFEVDLDTAKMVFEEADTKTVKNPKGEDCLDIEEFIQFYQIMTKRKEIEELFEKYNYEGKYLDATELQTFFEDEQHETLTIKECENLIKELEPCPKVKNKKMMSMDGFNALFNSPRMDLMNPKYSKIYMDMKRPLAHYFIDSSHNTYLTADQLMGPSAVESYIRALKLGCRCVELDCWDGSDDDPVIYHGHTLTSKILFKDVIRAVDTYAFEVSEYPVILSIENHCSIEQQRKMAQYMIEILGDKLVTTPLGDDVKELPSPEFYKGKILVKGKKLPDEKEEEDGYVSDEDEAAELENEQGDNEEMQEALNQVKEDLKTKSKEEKHKLAKELSDVVVICQSVSFKGFEHAKEKYNFKQMSSFGESKTMSLAEKEANEWVRLNAQKLSRVYPAGRRTDSSNYDPMPAWLAGNQIVALNYQTPDDPMQAYRGMFLDNGGCGYVLKPDYMNKVDSTFDPNGTFPEDWKRKFTLKIISGYQLPKKKKDKAKNILDPYVKVEILGAKCDCDTKKTETVENNGFHPVWDETLEFTIQCPDLAVVCFRVFDHEDARRNVMVAQYCLPFRCIQNGYRVVHLKSKYGEGIWGSQLLVHSLITQG